MYMVANSSGSKTENNTNYNHTKNAIAGWPQWNRLSRIYFLFVVLRFVYAPVSLSLRVCVFLSRWKQTLAQCRLPFTCYRHTVWYGFEHLLFTLVFNLKFNLLKQLKAHTSQPKYTHSPTFTLTFAYEYAHASARTRSYSFDFVEFHQRWNFCSACRFKFRQTIHSRNHIEKHAKG